MKPISTLLLFAATIFFALQSTAQEAHILKSTNDPSLQKLINEKKPVRFVIDQNANGSVVKFYEQLQQSKQTIIASNVSTAESANFHLTKDINAQTDANPANSDYIAGNPYAILNSVMYFSANDGVHGNELWRSDGTAGGTYLVKDIQPGINSSAPSEIIVANNKLYFTTLPTLSYTGGLWVSDGTDAGTIQLLSFASSGPGVNNSYSLTNVSGTVFFLCGGTYYPQVWKTNGTVQGTVMVKDLNGLGNSPTLYAAANGNYYFTLYSDLYGRELWKSDGTDAGTFMVKDISTSTDFFAGPAQLTPYNNKLYFSQDDGTGRKLWYTDGTTAGTQKAGGQDDISLSTDYSFFFVDMPFAILKNEIYFSASSTTAGTELFKYSTVNNFSLVKDITPGTDSGILYNITATGNFISFVYQNTDELQYQLWTTKGTADNSHLVKSYDNYSAFFSELTYNNGILYFTSNTTGYGNELWETKGTSASTVLVKDIYAGSTSSNPLYLTSFQNKLYFNAASKNSGTELWVTDGTMANTNILKEINSSSTDYSGPNYFNLYAGGGNAGKAIKNTLLFTATRPETGYELYASDGTSAGTSLSKDLIKGEGGSNPQMFTAVNNSVYFVAYTPDSTYYGQNLFKIDSNRNLVQVSNITNQSYGYISSFAVADNGYAYYILNSSSSPLPQLWRSDGTKEGNILLSDSLITLTYPLSLKTVHNKAFFTAGTANTGTELWVSDGTVAGTNLVKDIAHGSVSSNPYSLYAYNNEIYFGADNGSGNALWKSDGTTAGTIKLKAIQPYNLLNYGYDYNNYFCVSNNLLYLSATSANNGTGLWKTDGTSAGTVLIKVAGTGNSNPATLTDVNGILFFTAFNQQLWKTDGTTNGTALIQDFLNPFYLNFERCVADGKFFFNVNQLLWVSDGTDAGTQPVNDAGLNNVSLVSNLAVAGNTVFFNGYTDKYNYELYAGDATKVLQSVSSNKAIKESTFTATVLENPVRTALTIKIQSSKNQMVNIIVSDQQGRSISTQKTLINKGSNTIKMSAANWFNGLYFINLTGNAGDQIRLQVLK